MAVSTIKGVVSDTGTQAVLSNERVIDMDDVIAYLDPEVSQFTTMLMQVASKEAFSSKVEWLEDELFPRLSSLAASAASNDVTFTLPAGEGLYFRKDDIVRNSLTGEAFRCSIDGTSTVVTTTVAYRGIGTVTAASSATAAQLVIIGNAAARGTGLGTRLVAKRVNQFNNTQIQRNPYGFDNTLRASKLYGGPEPDKERKKKAIEHKRALEYLLFWGARGLLDTATANPVGTVGGVIEFLSTNVKDNGNTTISKANMDLYLRDILQHGSTNKVIFCSPNFAMALAGFGLTGLGSAWGPGPIDQRLFGVKIDSWLSGAYGFRIPVVVKRDWNDFSASSKQYGSMAFVIDMDYVKIRPLRNTQLLRDRQSNDSDTYDEEYLTEFSLEFQHERAHGLIKGVTG